MGEGVITFAASTPSLDNSKASGYRLFTCDDGRLSMVKHSCANNKNDIGASVQFFAYLKPKSRPIIPQHLNDDNLDASDYLLTAKSNGFIEIIRDYKYKSNNKVDLEPNFVLKCIPEDFNADFASSYLIASLKYKDGLLYCNMCSGRIYIFILNLPDDYRQNDNLYTTFPNESVTSEYMDTLTNEEAILNQETKYICSKPWHHLCYFLIPVENDHLRYSPVATYYGTMYKDKIIYRTSMFTQLERSITLCQINPYDKFSIITTGPDSPLIIRKIIISSSYCNFMKSFLHLKGTIQNVYNYEIKSWNTISVLLGRNIVFSCTEFDPAYDFGNASSVTWEDLARREGTGILQNTLVWKERIVRNPNDLESKNNSNSTINTSEIQETLASVPLNRRLRRRQVQFFSNRTLEGGSVSSRLRGMPSPREALSGLLNNEEESQTRYLRIHCTVTDFQIVHNPDPNLELSIGNFSSFLTDNYKHLSIVYTDKKQVCNVFRPTLQDTPIMSITPNIFNAKDEESIETFDSDRFRLKMTLNNLSCHKKIFMINTNLIIIIDIGGILLLDINNISDPQNLLNNPPSSVKAALFKIGLLNDALAIVDSFKRCNCSNVCEEFKVIFSFIVTTEEGYVLALRGTFDPHSQLGTLELRDSLKLTIKEKYVDKLTLIDFEHSDTRKKRPFNDETDSDSNNKRHNR
ncbi:hypothetical protein Kpol_2000p4 [Vanderwaltozyma polyspora DSM 70294]|uniref:Uncharacterized protein n=1 Tax=Vanderwaltozyma polyspora (strain ATCC 22028 / DSM 70294 / BCRC 21397 / CBS 2163 / NBRC 10782 / NRRL Y-8283 / UCD 57-17) TaxID=436907 RepID=A7TF15_VANPO|nr:uncharacterized protein Kpol_2000p4 [Vanderwaltozyma polyspora DSM 70294]EDO19040.1 hypothetical protein Kpol_2000p4 [Vanderwaltozyma polyspora DSM 70294]